LRAAASNALWRFGRPFKRGDSRWGRHSSWQILDFRKQSVERDRSVEVVATSSIVHDRSEDERPDEQRAQHIAAALDLASQQAAPVSELRSEPCLQAFKTDP
jgi:hypothetical protein